MGDEGCERREVDFVCTRDKDRVITSDRADDAGQVGIIDGLT
jgi:hypothetical protein